MSAPVATAVVHRSATHGRCFIGCRAAAEFLGFTEDQLRTMVRERSIPFHRMPATKKSKKTDVRPRFFFYEDELETFLRQTLVTPRASVHEFPEGHVPVSERLRSVMPATRELHS